MNKLFFDSWDSIMRTVLITVISYTLLIVLLRNFGKRTLSKMNAFDLVVTIALGSTLATVMLNKNVALADGILAFFLLILLQFLITFFSVRYNRVNHLVKSAPALLVYKGQLQEDLMKKERIAEDEIYAVIRSQGLGSVEEADAVVLETDGSLTVIKQLQSLEGAVMKPVRKPQNLAD